MDRLYESPTIAIATSGVDEQLPDAFHTGARLWDDVPTARIWGEQYKDQLHTAIHPLGRVAIVGDCFASDDELRQTLGQALEYKKPELLTHLPGRYAIVLLEQDSVTALASVAGTPTLYYKENSGGTIISTRAGIAGGDTKLSPNYDQVAANLAIPGIDASRFFGQESCFAGISKLSGGQALRVSHNTSRLYDYEPLRPSPDVTMDEAAQALYDALIQSLGARLRTGRMLSTDLSGGTDSGSLAFLLTDQLHQQELQAYFAGNPDLNEGDWQYAQRYAQMNPAIKLHTYDSRQLETPFTLAELEGMPRAEEFAVAVNASVYNWRFIGRYFKEITQNSDQLHITGNGGDEVLKVGPEYLADLLNRGDIGRYGKEVMHWARLYNVSPLKLGHVMAQLAINPSGVIAKAHRNVAQQSGENKNAILDVFNLLHPMQASMMLLGTRGRQEIAQFLTEKANDKDPLNGYSIGSFKSLEGLRATSHISQMVKFYANVGEPSSSAQSPFLDNNVVRAAFSLEASRKGSPHAFKPLLEHAMEGHIPPEVAARHTKGAYDEASSTIFNRSAATFEEFFDNSILEEAGIINEQVRKRFSHFNNLPIEQTWPLERILNAEGWLRQTLDQEPLKRVREHIPVRSIPAHEAVVTNVEDQVSIPAFVHAVAAEDGQLVLFNEQADIYHVLDTTQSMMLRLLVKTQSASATLQILQQRFSKVDPDVLDQDLRTVVSSLREKGLLQPGTITEPRTLPQKARTPDFVSGEFSAARGAAELKAKAADYVRTGTALLVGEIVLSKIAPQKKLPFLRFMQEKVGRNTASEHDAVRLVDAVQKLPYLGRIACREIAYVTSLAAALEGKVLDYHQGVSFKPLAFHAWVEAEGKPIRTPMDGQVVGSFQSFLK